MYEFYAFANVDQVAAVFNAVALITGGGGFHGAMKALAIAGLLAAVISAILVAQKTEAIFKYVLLVALFTVGLIVPKVDVTVIDSTGAAGSVVAPNVPVGLAFFATNASLIGRWATLGFETAFSQPDDLKFQNNGMMFGARVVAASRNFAVSKPEFRRDLLLYIRNCLNPDILDGYKTAETIRQSTDLWASIGDTNPGRWTHLLTGDRGATNCIEAYNFLTPEWVAERERATTLQGRLLNTNQPDPVLAKVLIESQIGNAYGTVLGISASASELVQQNMMVNLFADAAVAIPQMMGDPVAAQAAIANAQASSAAATQYQMMGQLADEALPKIRNTIELLIIGVFPLIFLLMIVSGIAAFKVLANYVGLIIWVQLWAPLYAILNYISTLSLTSKGKAALTGTSGLTLQNADLLQATMLTQQHIVGMLCVSIPVIAFGLVKLGAVAGDSLATSAMGPATSAAGKSAGQVGTGNASLGNTSLDNTSVNNTNNNKMDKEWMQASAAANIRTGELSIAEWGGRNAAASVSLAKNDPGALVASIQSGMVRSLTAMGEQSTTQAATTQSQGVSSLASAVANTVSTASSKVNEAAFGKDVSERKGRDFKADHAATAQLNRDIASSTGVDQTIVAEIAAAAALGGGVSVGGETERPKDGRKAGPSGLAITPKANLSAELKGSLSQKYGDSTASKVMEALKNTNGDKWGQASSYYHDLASNEGFRTSIKSAKTDTAGINASLTKGKSQIETSSAQLAQAQAYKEQASGVASGSTSSGINLLQSPAFAKMLPGMARDVNAALAKGDYAGAMDKIDERLAFMGLGLLQPSTAKAPSLLPSGAATPTEQSVTKAQENSAAKARGTVDPSAAYAKGKPKVDTSSVKAPAFAKDADKKIDGARDQLTEDFAETHQSNAKAIDAAKADIGVFKGKKTRDNPNGKVGTNRQTAGAVTEIAAQDVVVGGIYALSPVAGALDAVGSIVGKPNLGTDRQKLDAKRALGIDPEKLVRKKVE